jgi:hypothetical protein
MSTVRGSVDGSRLGIFFLVIMSELSSLFVMKTDIDHMPQANKMKIIDPFS